MKKICPQCGSEFETNYPFKKYCSKQCCDSACYEQRHPKKPRLKKICPTCGKEFEANHADRIYCSGRCQLRRWRADHSEKPSLKKICPHCGKEFQPARASQIYCGKRCRNSACYERCCAKETHSKETPLKKCPICGNEFEAVGKQKYCSKGCYLVRQAEQQRERHGTQLTKKICPICGKEFEAVGKQKFCSQCRDVKYKKKCANCGKEFHTRNSKQRYCPECNKPFVYKRKCLYCGQEFETERVTKNFCSQNCQEKYHDKRLKKNCPTCGVEFHGTAKFCPECMKYIRTGKKPEEIIKIRTKTLTEWIREAAECNMDYGTYRALVEKMGKTFEECKAMDKTPQNHRPDGVNAHWRG